MYGIQRKSEIINLLERNGKVDASNLAARFKVSKETIRRDLNELEGDGVLRRTHGGAVIDTGEQKSNEYPVSIREIQRFSEKNEICKKAASYIEDGDVIFADNSSTTMYIAQYIPKNIHVTVLTNSIGLLFESSKYACENHTFICLGGIFKSRNLSLHGNTTVNNINEYFPNKAFISCAGINIEKGMATDGSIDEVDAKKLMIEHAEKVFLLADHTKWERNGQVFLSSLNNIDVIITDSKKINKTAFSDYDVIIDMI